MTLLRSRTVPVLLLVCALALALVATLAPTADAAKRKRKRAVTWAPAASATITPGVQMYTDGSQCTANFVFTDRNGGVYVGYAAHCAGLGEATDTSGCGQDSVPLGTPVTFERGGSLLTSGTVLGRGTLVYSSWETMNRLGTTDPVVCDFNDFALVKVAGSDVSKVNPSVPVWGGPTGIDTDGLGAGESVWSYGNSSLRAGIELLSPKQGIALGDDAADQGWSHLLYTVTPGVPGDSGSGFLSADGLAVGTLSTLGLTPFPLSNNIGDLARELAFAQEHSGIPGLKLALGTEPFSPLL
ncbi:hypothetical protein NOMA109596_15815 [Nocardioides marinus]|uniref:Trypsin-like peptidase domain-containing protein n=1 Tax=Nocardioides marinus TaxID=374514 RepID=A0A7Y9YE64_9ACTN|nr:hypothetical protein [Nocardioides marinus]NYI09332.1 hypothetical protein [Nocardioides marinus]